MFVALPLPEDVRDGLRQAATAVTRGDQPVFKLVDRDSMHVTLYFLGMLDEDEAEGVRSALAGVKADPFELRAGKVLRLPSDTVPKVVAVGVESSGNELARFQRRIHDTVFATAENKETRPFLPHVTLARLSAGVPGYAKPVKRSLEGFRSVGQVSWQADRFELLVSHQGEGGPVYETVETFLLGG